MIGYFSDNFQNRHFLVFACFALTTYISHVRGYSTNKCIILLEYTSGCSFPSPSRSESPQLRLFGRALLFLVIYIFAALETQSYMSPFPTGTFISNYLSVFLFWNLPVNKRYNCQPKTIQLYHHLWRDNHHTPI